MSTNVSEKHIASIFKVEKISRLPPDFALVSCSAYFFDPEDGAVFY
jgi:hypothetical protein